MSPYTKAILKRMAFWYMLILIILITGWILHHQQPLPGIDLVPGKAIA